MYSMLILAPFLSRNFTPMDPFLRNLWDLKNANFASKLKVLNNRFNVQPTQHYFSCVALSFFPCLTFNLSQHFAHALTLVPDIAMKKKP